MINKNFDEIGLADIQALIENEEAESNTIEYKETLVLNTNSEKKEFLADISSFANTGGGDIIYGISERRENGNKTGIPEKITPLSDGTADETKLRMEGIIQRGLAPRLPVQIKGIRGVSEEDNDFVIVVRIPQSPARPHMVVQSGTSRFYSRNSAGKFKLDVDQIRSAFFATESQAEKVRLFIRERLGAIVADETPVKLEKPYRLVIHLIPINSFLNRERVTFPEPNHTLHEFLVLSGEWMNHSTYCLDGYVTHSPIMKPNLDCRGYCHLQFSGFIESVDSSLVHILNDKRQYDDVNGKPHVSLFNIDNIINDCIKAYIEGYKVLGISPPLLLSVALLGFRGVNTVTDEYSFSDREYSLDRNIAVLPSVMIDNITEDVSQHLKPLLDSLWNAFGFERCLDYNQQGIWQPLHPMRRN